MLKEIENPGPGIVVDDINALESRLGKKIPDDYAQFLIKYNGGSPIECMIDFDGNKLNISGNSIGYFFGLKRKSDLINKLENMSHILPELALPIADTPGGNYFILSLNNNTYGKVFYKDHEIEDSFDFKDDENNLPESMVLVANSFSEFLDKLYDPDEE